MTAAPEAAPPPSRVLVGTAGWSYPDWEGRVYPVPHPRGFHPLAFLARYVDLVEVNSTFYAVPPPRNAERWVALTRDRPGFTFLAKLHQGFTHEAWPADGRGAARAYQDAVRPLSEAGRLSAVLAQFPWSFRFDEAGRERLGRIAGLFPDLPLVLEVRHRSWFGEEGLGFLGGLPFSLAHLDLPTARDHPPPRHPSVGPIGYVRLHGRNREAWFRKDAGRDERYDYLYGRAELEGIAARLKEVAVSSRNTFVVTNNHYGGKALANALEIKGLLEGRPPLAPPALRSAFPHLAEVTRPDGPEDLFG